MKGNNPKSWGSNALKERLYNQRQRRTQQLYFWVFTEETQNTESKRHTHPYVHCSIIYSSQDREAT